MFYETYANTQYHIFQSTNICVSQLKLLISYSKKLQYSKRTKRWRPVNVLEPKEYSYIPELLVNVFLKRVAVPGTVTQRLTMSEDDPRNIARNIAIIPQPTLEEAIQSHQSRFEK